MTIYTLESVKVHLFALQYTIVIELFTWLSVVELAFEQAYLIVECLKLIIEGTPRYWRLSIFLVIQCWFIFVRLGGAAALLKWRLLGGKPGGGQVGQLYLFLSCLFIKFSCHEVLVGMQVTI